MTPKQRSWNRFLPVYNRVIFVDWHGVLSETEYWSSIKNHPALATHGYLSDAIAELFATSDVVDSWMRGHLDTRHVIRQFLVRGDDPRLAAFLERWIVDECRQSVVKRRLMQTLRRLRRQFHVVLATDNMDCFGTAVQQRHDLMTVFDDYLSSAELGFLKAESPDRFFLPWLEEHGISVAASILVDDRRRNCEGFRGLGGEAIEFDGSRSAWDRIAGLDRWPAVP